MGESLNAGFKNWTKEGNGFPSKCFLFPQFNSFFIWKICQKQSRASFVGSRLRQKTVEQKNVESTKWTNWRKMNAPISFPNSTLYVSIPAYFIIGQLPPRSSNHPVPPVFFHFPLYSLQFLSLISALTCFHSWGLLTKWAQLLITSNYYLPSTPKDQSMMRADLTEALRIKVVGS